MLRSLYSGVSGMKVNQVKMDVIGNNIANVGTTAFKSGRVRFQDMISQKSKDPMAPMVNNGGINPGQVGLGVQVSGIDTIVSQGLMQPTGRNLDVGIDGEGYFMVGKGPETFTSTITVDPSDGKHSVDTSALSAAKVNINYTRDGSFTLDSSGNLLTSDGYRVMGYSIGGSINDDGTLKFVDASVATTADDTALRTLRIPDKVDDGGTSRVVKSYTISKEGIISAVLDNDKVTALGQIATASFKNPAGLSKVGKNLLVQSTNSGDPVLRTGIGTAGADNSKGYGDLAAGMLEMSNVDLAEQFTDMIVTSRAFQANGKMITTGDEILQDIINLKR